ncbi:Gnk2-homologous domain [Sesbania bispinosa]|nr:Gnk2-homologous domain [Sesbania bispinosa]
MSDSSTQPQEEAIQTVQSTTSSCVVEMCQLLCVESSSSLKWKHGPGSILNYLPKETALALTGNNKFVVKQGNASANITLYGLALCTSDLSVGDCTRCVALTRNNKFAVKQDQQLHFLCKQSIFQLFQEDGGGGGKWWAGVFGKGRKGVGEKGECGTNGVGFKKME